MLGSGRSCSFPCTQGRGSGSSGRFVGRTWTSSSLGSTCAARRPPASHDQGAEEQPAALGGPHARAGGGPAGDPSRRRADFCDDDGGLLRPGQFQQVLWAAQKRAGLRRIKWHDLRHSYASILASGGMPLFLIRGLLGHSSITMTERYAHLAASQTAAYMPLLSTAAPSNPTPPSVPPASSNGPQAGPSTLASRN